MNPHLSRTGDRWIDPPVLESALPSHTPLSGHSINGQFRESRSNEGAADRRGPEKRLAALGAQRMSDHSQGYLGNAPVLFRPGHLYGLDGASTIDRLHPDELYEGQRSINQGICGERIANQHGSPYQDSHGCSDSFSNPRGRY